MAVLVGLDGAFQGRAHELDGPLVLGRDPGCDLVLEGDGEASSRHLTLRPEGDRWVVEDHSRNGTLLNGAKLEHTTALSGGDELLVGNTRLLFVARDPMRTAGAGAYDETMQAITGVGKMGPLVGDSPPLQEVKRRIFYASKTDAAVLITGESGTGKELVARAVHDSSERRDGPLATVNAARLSGELLESELFGHEEGAFTGATGARKGVFEQADGGTLFIDEFGELPLATQARLLRVLETQSFRRVGGETEVTVDVRLVAATNRDLRAAIAEGEFREDLYYRVAVLTIELPPLRDRGDDIVLLAARFLAAIRRERGCAAARFTPEASAALRRYPFPGNVRELRNIVEQVGIYCRRADVGVDDLPSVVRGVTRAIDAPPDPTGPGWLERAAEAGLALDAIEKRYIEMILARADNKKAAAQLLGISRGTLYKRMEQYGLRD